MTVPPGNQPPLPPQGGQPPLGGQPPYQPPAPQPPAQQYPPAGMPPMQQPPAPAPAAPPAGYGAPPPSFQPPPPPSYPTTPPAPAHKLSGAVIAGIVAVIVLIAGGVTAAIVLTGKSSKSPSQSGQNLGNGKLGNGTPTPQPTPTGGQPTPQPTPTQGGQPTPQPTPTQGGQPTTQPAPAGNGGSGIALGGGITLTPAAGWSVISQDKGYVALAPSDHSAIFETSVGKGNGDISSTLTAYAQAWAKGAGAQNLQVGNAQAPQSINGKNFQQLVSMPFAAVLSTQQGTVQLYGVFLVLYNPSSGLAAGVTFSHVQQKAPDTITNAAGAMLQSLA